VKEQKIDSNFIAYKGRIPKNTNWKHYKRPKQPTKYQGEIMDIYKHHDIEFGAITGIFDDGTIEVIRKGGFTEFSGVYLEGENPFALIDTKTNKVI
jgi:hypothetical protein